MASNKSVPGLIIGFFNGLSLTIFVVPALVVGISLLWVIGTSLFGAKKPDGSEHKFTHQDCGIPGVATGEVVVTVVREKGVETIGRTECWLEYQPGHFTKSTSGRECYGNGQRGVPGKIPDPKTWGLNRPEIEICYVFALRKS